MTPSSSDSLQARATRAVEEALADPGNIGAREHIEKAGLDYHSWLAGFAYPRLGLDYIVKVGSEKVAEAINLVVMSKLSQ